MPTTTGKASEFITFSRTSNATVTDSDGKIKWAPHNLLLASEQFDSASWPKFSLSVAANAVAAPNGTTTADTATITGGYGSIYQGGAVPIGTHTFSVFAKAGTISSINLLIDSGLGAGRGASFTLSGSGTAGAVTNNSSGAGTVSGGTSSIAPLSGGWYLCTLANFTTTASNSAFASSSNDGTFHIWGASLYRSDLGGMKANTSTYPMYNPTTPKNLLGFTEDFSNAAWVKGAATVTANSAVAPNGLQTADTISFPANVFTYQSVSFALQSGKPYTISFYVRADAATDINIGINGNSSALTNKAANVSVGTTWQRVSFSSTGAATETVVYVGLGTAAIGTGASVINEARTIYLWGAQLSDSASLDTYVPNYGAAPTAAAYYGPRLDADPVTLAQRGLLVEELRTNLVLYSAQFDVSANWVPSAGVSVSANTDISPDGTLTADTMNSSAGNQIDQSVSCSTSTVYTNSLYFKKTSGAAYQPALYLLFSGGTLVIYAVRLNTDTGVATAVSAGGFTAPSSFAVQDAGSYWRLSITGNSNNNTTASFRLYPNLTAGGGAGAGSQIIWGAQLEAGSFATSYIPTGAATATRNADVASVSTQAFPYSSTEGTVVVNFIRPTSVLNAHAISFTATNSNTGPGIVVDNLSGGVRALYYDGTTVSPDGSVTSVGAAGTVVKAALGYKSADTARSINGGTVATSSASLSTVSFTTMRIGDSPAMQNPINGHIRQITYLPRRISNAELVTRST